MLLSVRHSQINGETAVPGSKSHTIRALAIAALAKKASEKGTGARGLRSIMESIMLAVMYDVPSRKDVKECVITDETVNGAPAKLVLKKK